MKVIMTIRPLDITLLKLVQYLEPFKYYSSNIFLFLNSPSFPYCQQVYKIKGSSI